MLCRRAHLSLLESLQLLLKCYQTLLEILNLGVLGEHTCSSGIKGIFGDL